MDQKVVIPVRWTYRIKTVHRNGVQLTNLDGSPADTQNIGHVYPYNLSQDPILEAFDRRLLTTSDKEASVGLVEGMMIVVDLTESSLVKRTFELLKCSRSYPRMSSEFTIMLPIPKPRI